MPEEKWGIGRDPGHFRPMRDLEDMRHRFDEDIVRPVMHAIWEHMPDEAKTWSPSIDVFEKSDSLIIKAELPGMKQEDIDVYVSEDALTIKGQKKRESGIKDTDYHRNEAVYGAFYRSINLPFSVETKNIDAVYEDGILHIILQRAAGAKPQKINIQVKKSAA